MEFLRSGGPTKMDIVTSLCHKIFFICHSNKLCVIRSHTRMLSTQYSVAYDYLNIFLCINDIYGRVLLRFVSQSHV